MLVALLLTIGFFKCEDEPKNETKPEPTANDTLPEVTIEKLYEPEICDVLTDVGHKVKVSF